MSEVDIIERVLWAFALCMITWATCKGLLEYLTPGTDKRLQECRSATVMLKREGDHGRQGYIEFPKDVWIRFCNRVDEATK